ncbi:MULTISPECIES: hypothetical protein [Pseudomonas]|uniref:hypothetical protein n=1 Tax=Pseudomonas TaxID=286 RepID=UPI0012AD8800|nr:MULTISPECIES: hypothetical protein [Pseudomonas]MCK2112463.1 hypothetical protein [Pseudomonas juntendi]MCK2116963.1 hypothetical protein [Pseudomonas juntendi]MDG9808471.1 hypothetical protein [Pseudomonas juntendi]MRT60144.1 hypothetical protein [Pseudomonas sp. CAH-1]
MINSNVIALSADKRNLWMQAGKAFPGKKLNEVMIRALADISVGQAQMSFYEIRRIDAPLAFDALLKIQSTRAAHRYIEADQEGFREVLRVERTLFDAIMRTISLLLDVIAGILLPNSSGGGAPPAFSYVVDSTEGKPYVPTWKRSLARISFDEPAL